MELAIGWPSGVNCCDELVVERVFSREAERKLLELNYGPEFSRVPKLPNFSLALILWRN